MDYGYHENLLLPKDINPNKEVSWEDTAVVANPYAVAYNRPDLSVYTQSEGTPLNPKDKQWDEVYKSLTPTQKSLFLDSTSIEDFGRRVAREDYISTATQNFQADQSYTKYAAALATGVLDPTVLIPIGGVVKGVDNAINTTRTIAKSMAIGSAFGVGLEAQFGAQDRDTNYLHAGFFGAGLGLVGGAISAKLEHNTAISSDKGFELFPTDTKISEGAIQSPYVPTPISIDRGKLKSKGSKGAISKQETITYKPLEDDASRDFLDNPYINIEDSPSPDIAPIVTNNTPNLSETVTPDMEKYYGPNALKSSFDIIMSSPIDTLRNVVFKMFPIISSAKAGGKIIKQGTTAFEDKRVWEGLKNKTTLDLKSEYNKARELGYSKNEEDFFNDTFKQYTKEVTEWYNTPTESRIPFKASHPTTELYRKYFNDMLDIGQKLGVKALQEIDTTHPYFPVMYDFKTLNTMERSKLNSLFYDSLAGDIRNKGMTESQLRNSAEKIADMFKNQAYSLDFYDKSVIMPSDIRVSGQLKDRTMYLDHSKLHEIIDTDGYGVLSRYSHNQSGVYAVHKVFGTTDFDSLKPIVSAAVKEAEQKGIPIQDHVRAFEDLVRDLRGTLRIPQDPTSLGLKVANNITAYNNISNGWNFGINSMAEVANVFWGTSWKRMFNVGDMAVALKQASTLIHGKGVSGANNLAKSIIATGYLHNGANSTRTAMFEAGTGISDYVLGKGGLLQSAQHKIFKGTLLYTITDALEYFAGSSVIKTIMELGGKETIDTKSLQKMSVWGLDHQDVKDITSKIKELNINDVHDLNIERLPDRERHLLETALSKTISTSVLQSDSVHLPRFMINGSDKPLVMLTTQWMKFPLIATNTLLQKGIREDKVGLIVAAAMSGGVVATIAYLKEDAQIALGLKDKNKRKFDLSTPEGVKNLAAKAANYMGAVGMLQPVAQYVMELYGMENKYGRVHSSNLADFLGPTAGKADDLISTFPDAARAILEGHPPSDRKTYAAYQQLIFFLSAPIIGEVYNDWADKAALSN